MGQRQSGQHPCPRRLGGRHGRCCSRRLTICRSAWPLQPIVLVDGLVAQHGFVSPAVLRCPTGRSRARREAVCVCVCVLACAGVVCVCVCSRHHGVRPTGSAPPGAGAAVGAGELGSSYSPAGVHATCSCTLQWREGPLALQLHACTLCALQLYMLWPRAAATALSSSHAVCATRQPAAVGGWPSAESPTSSWSKSKVKHEHTIPTNRHAAGHRIVCSCSLRSQATSRSVADPHVGRPNKLC